MVGVVMSRWYSMSKWRGRSFSWTLRRLRLHVTDRLIHLTEVTVTLIVTRQDQKYTIQRAKMKTRDANEMGIIRKSQKLVADAKMVMKPGGQIWNSAGTFIRPTARLIRAFSPPPFPCLPYLPPRDGQLPLWCACQKLKLESTHFCCSPARADEARRPTGARSCSARSGCL